MSNFCYNCGHKLLPGGKFCANCGTAVSAAVASLPPIPAAPSVAPSAPMKQEQTYMLDSLGKVSIDYYHRTFRLELYEEKDAGFFIFKHSVRGKCIINKLLNFSQLINYKIVDVHEAHRTCASYEKRTGVRQFDIYRLGIELYIDDPQGYYYVGMGNFRSHKDARKLLGTLASALEMVMQQR